MKVGFGFLWIQVGVGADTEFLLLPEILGVLEDAAALAVDKWYSCQCVVTVKLGPKIVEAIVKNVEHPGRHCRRPS